eukprot:RCo048107
MSCKVFFIVLTLVANSGSSNQQINKFNNILNESPVEPNTTSVTALRLEPTGATSPRLPPREAARGQTVQKHKNQSVVFTDAALPSPINTPESTSPLPPGEQGSPEARESNVVEAVEAKAKDPGLRKEEPEEDEGEGRSGRPSASPPSPPPASEEQPVSAPILSATGPPEASPVVASEGEEESSRGSKDSGKPRGKQRQEDGEEVDAVRRTSPISGNATTLRIRARHHHIPKGNHTRPVERGAALNSRKSSQAVTHRDSETSHGSAAESGGRPPSLEGTPSSASRVASEEPKPAEQGSPGARESNVVEAVEAKAKDPGLRKEEPEEDEGEGRSGRPS